MRTIVQTFGEPNFEDWSWFDAIVPTALFLAMEGPRRRFLLFVLASRSNRCPFAKGTEIWQ